MKERINLWGESEQTPAPQDSKEREKLLILTCSEKTQKGLLTSLLLGLGQQTDCEVKFGGKAKIDIGDAEENNEVRKVVIAILRNLGMQVKPEGALHWGLTEFIPAGKLEEWANKDVRQRPDLRKKDLHIKELAQYFLKKQNGNMGEDH